MTYGKFLAETQESVEKHINTEESLAKTLRFAKGAKALFENQSLILINSCNNKDYEG